MVSWGTGYMNHTETSGFLPRGPQAEIIRPLTAVDLALLNSDGSAKTPTIKKIRDAHHRLAILIAQGCTGKEISETTGYSISRISILKGDPTFSQLVEFYRAKKIEGNVEEIVGVTKKMIVLHEEVLEEMHDRLQSAPELVTNDTLTDWFKFLSDRIGYGPQTKSLNVNATLDLASDVAAGRQRALELSAAEPVAAAKPRLEKAEPPTGARGSDE